MAIVQTEKRKEEMEKKKEVYMISVRDSVGIDAENAVDVIATKENRHEQIIATIYHDKTIHVISNGFGFVGRG